MKWIRWSLVLVILSSSVSGCLVLKKKKKRSFDQTESSYQDVPLESFSLENFHEVKNEGILGLFPDIYFDYNQYQLKRDHEAVLGKIADWMNANSRVHLLVEGHSDERGSNDYNMALGEQRALSVRSVLIELGVASNRVQTISYGEEKPLNNIHSETGWRKNRRAHFLIAEEN